MSGLVFLSPRGLLEDDGDFPFPLNKERKRGRDNVGDERAERHGEVEAGARPEPVERLGQAGGKGGWEHGGRLVSICLIYH